MKITGHMLIGADDVLGTGMPIFGVDPASDQPLEPAFPGGTADLVDRACALARSAFNPYRRLPVSRRALFLETIASEIEALGDRLITRAHQETGLPVARLQGERQRTTTQLRLFAREIQLGHWIDARIDNAQPQRLPAPRSDLRLQHIPLGPVAVFGASNFPLAFSVAGGDTAAALAAGAPVIVKAHSAHPGTSELVGRAVRKAAQACGMPEGVFSMLFGSGADVGQALARHPAIQAIAFTGSRAGGIALMQTAAARPAPIPVYAEMSSINPVIVLPGALGNSQQALSLAQGFVQSLTLGAGQFCTNPGLVIAMHSPAMEDFILEAGRRIAAAPAATMLTRGIHAAYVSGVTSLQRHPGVQCIAQGIDAGGPTGCRPALFRTEASTFLADPAPLCAEVFGASALVVMCDTEQQMHAIIHALEGQLTATLLLDPAQDHTMACALLEALELKAGRILVNGFPTGVEVCDAMVHGGPFPATSDGRSTSVGTAAIHRFLRPVCYQDMPISLLAPALQPSNPLNIPRREN